MSASDAGEDIVGASRQGIRRVSKGIVDDVLDHATNHTPILSANDSRELDASEEEFASGVQLFDGWVQYVTDDRQDVFFYNTLSHVTQWERPLPRPNVNPSTPKRTRMVCTLSTHTQKEAQAHAAHIPHNRLKIFCSIYSTIPTLYFLGHGMVAKAF